VIGSDNFSVFHCNIRSFHKNSDELLILLSRLSHKPDIIVLTETWFSEGFVGEMDSYQGFHVYRNNRRGGGVSIFVRMNLVCDLCHRTSRVENCIEVCKVKVADLLLILLEL